MCKRCNFTPSRCDIPVWKTEGMTDVVLQKGEVELITNRPELSFKAKPTLKDFF